MPIDVPTAQNQAHHRRDQSDSTEHNKNHDIHEGLKEPGKLLCVVIVSHQEQCAEPCKAARYRAEESEQGPNA